MGAASDRANTVVVFYPSSDLDQQEFPFSSSAAEIYAPYDLLLQTLTQFFGVPNFLAPGSAV